MNESLSSLGAQKFIEHAYEVAAVNRAQIRRGGASGPKSTLSFDIFIKIISKYTANRSPVALDANIRNSSDINMHRLFVQGISDVGIRMKHGSRFLPGNQEGTWSCWLEEVLIKGVLAHQVSQLRETLNLLPEYGIDNNDFFQVLLELI